MQCSRPAPVSRGLAVASPSLPLVAVANGNVLELHDVRSNAVARAVTTSGDRITHIAWAPPPAALLAAASAPTNSVAVVDARSGAVVADVHDSALRVSGLALSPRALLVAAAAPLPAAVFDIARPRLRALVPHLAWHAPAAPLAAWSPCARRLALVTRVDAVDGLVVLALPAAAPVARLRGPTQLAGIHAVAGIKWLPHGILLWGAPLDPLAHAALALFSPAGAPLSYHTLPAPDSGPGTCPGPAPYAAVGPAIKTVAADPTGNLLAIGGYDACLRLFNLPKWRVVTRFRLDKPEVDHLHPPVIFRERTFTPAAAAHGGEHDTAAAPGHRGENDPAAANPPSRAHARAPGPGPGKRPPPPRRSCFDVLPPAARVEITKRVRSAHAPHSNHFGVSFAHFSHDARFLAARADHAANVVFIWHLPRLRLTAVIILEQDARSLRWSRPPLHPSQPDTGPDDVGPQLAISCGGDFVYLWRHTGAAAISVRATVDWHSPFHARKLAWSHDNSALVVTDPISAKAFVNVYIS